MDTPDYKAFYNADMKEHIYVTKMLKENSRIKNFSPGNSAVRPI